MGAARCGSEAVEFACTAGVYDQAGPVLTCSPDTLLRLLRVAAWYAIRQTEHPDDDYEAFRNRLPTPLGPSAFVASSPGRATPVVEAAIEHLRAAAESAEGFPREHQGQLFIQILNMTFAAMFGHEASHLEEKAPYCAVSQQSYTEESGLWAVLLRVSSSGELYKTESPNRTEVVADRCAGRRIRLERSQLSESGLSVRDQRFVRRAAADIVSTMLVSHDAGTASGPTFRLNEAYLLPPLRILALAGEMGAADEGPIVCGGTAENLVQAAQETFRGAPGNGLMPDEMENTLPKGVIAAWARHGQWSPAAYSCR